MSDAFRLQAPPKEKAPDEKPKPTVASTR
jgi:hypothetical protein